MAAPLVLLAGLVAIQLALLAPPAGAVELTLDTVSATTGSGDVRLRVTSRATFNFDPGAGTLVSSGTWLAEYLLPNQVTRFGHQVEDLSATAGGQLAMKSYQCIEGTFATTFLAANLCGNYRFGPNGIDEGGAVDDIVLGPPRSLAGWSIGAFEWDGTELRLELLPGEAASASDQFQESGLTLRLKARPAR